VKRLTVISVFLGLVLAAFLAGCQDSGNPGVVGANAPEELDGSFRVYGVVGDAGDPVWGAYVEVQVYQAGKFWGVASDYTNEEGEYDCPDCSPTGWTRVMVMYPVPYGNLWYTSPWTSTSGSIYERNIDLASVPDDD